MNHIQISYIYEIIELREKMINNDKYKKYVGRNNRMIVYLNKIKNNLGKKLDEEIKNNLIEYCKNQLHNFRNIPTLDKSEQGLNLYKLELLIYGNCCDYFQSI